jgi:hypothetical protein
VNKNVTVPDGAPDPTLSAWHSADRQQEQLQARDAEIEMILAEVRQLRLA